MKSPARATRLSPRREAVRSWPPSSHTIRPRGRDPDTRTEGRAPPANRVCAGLPSRLFGDAECRTEERPDLAVLDSAHPHRVELKAGVVGLREEDLPGGRDDPTDLRLERGVDARARVALPFSIAALYAQSAAAVSPSKFETGRFSIFWSKAACTRTGLFLGRNDQAVARKEFTMAPFTSPHVPCQELRRHVGASQYELLWQLELLELLHDRRTGRRRRPKPERLRAGALDLPSAPPRSRSTPARRSSCPRSRGRTSPPASALLRWAVATVATVVAHQPDLLDSQLP